MLVNSRWPPDRCITLPSMTLSSSVQTEVFLASTFLHTALLQRAGLVAAAAALRHRAQPPVMNLRNLNPYVASALTDWRKVATNLAAAVPRGETNNGRFLFVVHCCDSCTRLVWRLQRVQGDWHQRTEPEA